MLFFNYSVKIKKLAPVAQWIEYWSSEPGVQVRLLPGAYMKKIFLITFSFCFLFLISFRAQAAGLIPCGGKGQSPCQLCDFLVLFQNIVNFLLFKIVPPVAALMIVIGGIMFFMGGASPGMLQKAKSLLTSVAIGLVIIYGAWVFVNTFFMLIGLSQFGEFGFDLRQWWKFPCP